MVITSLKGKRSQGVGASAWGPVGPASALNIQQVFTFANCLRQPTMKSVRVSFRRQLNGVLSFSLSLSFSCLLFSFIYSSLLRILSTIFISVLAFLPHDPARGTQRGGGCLLPAQSALAPEAARNYIWILIKRMSGTNTARS